MTEEIDAIGGPRLYHELRPALALGVERVSKRLVERDPADMRFSFGGIMDLHAQAFEGIVAWAGQVRTQDVVVSDHFPPPWHRVRDLLKDFADTLEFRVQALDPDDLDPATLGELFAFCEGRFTHIHPFKDFNGRVSRLLSLWLVIRLNLPHTIPLSPREGDDAGKAEVLAALGAYDRGNWQPLEEVWRRRIEGAFLELAEELGGREP